MKLKTLGLAFVATAFMAGTALAQSGTMQPIPNPPEKHKTVHHKKKAKAAASDDAAKSADAAKPADKPKK
jgi:delta 1-pyrroline-5-carboxylate dehydrogenase